MTLVETRRVQRKVPYGKYGFTLPIGWVRKVEDFFRGQEFRVVEMYERNDFLQVVPALDRGSLTQLTIAQAERFRDGSRHLMTLRELRRALNEQRMVETRPIGQNGPVFRRVYRVGVNARVVPLYENWISRMEKKLGHGLYYVGVGIYDLQLALSTKTIVPPCRPGRPREQSFEELEAILWLAMTKIPK